MLLRMHGAAGLRVMDLCQIRASVLPEACQRLHAENQNRHEIGIDERQDCTSLSTASPTVPRAAQAAAAATSTSSTSAQARAAASSSRPLWSLPVCGDDAGPEAAHVSADQHL